MRRTLSKVREHWIKDLDFLDKNFNIKKTFLDILFNEGLEEPYKKVKKLVDEYYKRK